MLIRDKGYKKVAIFYKNDDWGQDIGRLVAADLAGEATALSKVPL